jgi:hypothetical protein
LADINSSQLTYPTSCRLNKRYLGEFSVPPSARLVALKAPKGTGKTEWLTKQVQMALDRGTPALVLTHRVQLGQALCGRFGTPYVSEIKDSEFGKTLGYGLCVEKGKFISRMQISATSVSTMSNL